MNKNAIEYYKSNLNKLDFKNDYHNFDTVEKIEKLINYIK